MTSPSPVILETANASDRNVNKNADIGSFEIKNNDNLEIIERNIKLGKHNSVEP